MSYFTRRPRYYFPLCARSTTLLVLTHLLVAPLASGQPKIYWLNNEDQHISQANLDGSSQEILIEYRFLVPGGITVDASTGDLYWADAGTVGRTGRSLSSLRERVGDGKLV